MKINREQQRNFFNNEKNQYKRDILLQPPIHTLYEFDQIKKILRDTIKGKKIIDFGAGTGRISFPLLKEGYSVTAVDISEESLHRLEQLAKERKYINRLKVKTSLKGLCVDGVVGTDILHHVILEEYLGKIFSALDEKGVMVFSEPNAYNASWYFFFPLYALFNRKSIIETLKVEKGFLQCTYERIYQGLKNTGFTTVRLYGHGLLPPPLLSWSKRLSKLNYILSDVPFLRTFAYRFIIFAQKGS